MHLEQKDLATQIGLNPANLSRLETGQAIATVEQVALIARALQTTAGSIVAQADDWAQRLETSGYRVTRSDAEEPSDGSPFTAPMLGGLLVTLFSQSGN